MRDWNGHEPATSDVLLDLLTTAHTGRTRFSIAQRALFTACEFWAATKNSALMEHLSDDTENKLQAAEQSFTLIGLKWTTVVIKRARLQLAVDTPVSLQQIIEEMQSALSGTDEPVDAAIATFAGQARSGEPNLKPK